MLGFGESGPDGPALSTSVNIGLCRVVLLVTTHDPREEIMLKDFYLSFSAVCFTLLGLWLIVVQTRHAEWRGSPLRRRRAYAVAMHFSLPGLMSLLALVDPESSVLWRASFAIAAIGGAMALIALRGAAPGKLGLTAYISAIVLYLLIGLLAIAPHSAARLGLQAAPLRVEAALLIILVFAGVNVAWLLLFEPAPSEYAAPGRADNVTDRRNLAIRCGPASTGS
jgi:hypothetical protein